MIRQKNHQPEACETCHMGLDHEQIEYYKTSKHGVIFDTERNTTRTPTSRIEAEFFEMYKYALVHSWKGAYHMNPDYAHWYGWAQLNLQLEKIKGENRTLRRLAALEKAEKSIPGFEAVAAIMAVAGLAVILFRKKR